MASLEKKYELKEWNLIYLKFKEIILARLEKYPEQKDKWEDSLIRLEAWHENIKKEIDELFD